MARAKVDYDKGKGPVTLEIDSGFSCLGTFILAIREKKIGAPYVEFGREPKRIDDDIPDIHLIPIDPGLLDKHRVFIAGKYAPAFGKSQIKVTYSFIQQGKLIHETEVKKSLPAGTSFLRTEHDFDFVAK